MHWKLLFVNNNSSNLIAQIYVHLLWGAQEALHIWCWGLGWLSWGVDGWLRHAYPVGVTDWNHTLFCVLAGFLSVGWLAQLCTQPPAWDDGLRLLLQGAGLGWMMRKCAPNALISRRKVKAFSSVRLVSHTKRSVFFQRQLCSTKYRRRS